MSNELCLLCNIEKSDIHFEPINGFIMHVCANCLKLAEDNFVWYCMKCHHVWYKDKEETIELDAMLEDSKDQEIIMAIDTCVNCEPSVWGKYDHTGGMTLHGDTQCS